MLNRIIKVAFSLIGAVTGFTFVYVFTKSYSYNASIKVFTYGVASVLTAALFYFIASKIIDALVSGLDKLELSIQKMTLYELTVSSIGLIAGLIVANLIAIPINKIDVIGVPLSVIINIFFGFLGIAIALGKKSEALFQGTAKKGEPFKNIIDTSVIIDGRIADICKTGFLHGELVVPGFVLEELRHIADSSDILKRNRGRRGLDILNILQKDMEYPVKIENIEVEEGGEVDDKLLKVAKKIGARIITVDFNLIKVADFQGISVLNINELANAVKPIALPGEEMVIQVVKDGKENGQGIGYMDDGTMIVVDGGRKHMGETISVMVTSVLQTAAGRMIFAKPRCNIERVV
ncbi:MAG: TRAM domain-containing protein [Clostridia bacterium]|nr:TRAM domain-containing protein [Clostridia bacterium]